MGNDATIQLPQPSQQIAKQDASASGANQSLEFGIGFEWVRQASAWDTKFEELVAFKSEKGVSKCMTLVCFGGFNGLTGLI